MGCEVSKEQPKYYKKHKKHDMSQPKLSKKVYDNKNLSESRKTELCSENTQLQHLQSERKLQNISNSIRNSNPQKIIHQNLKSSSLDKHPNHKIKQALKQSEDESMPKTLSIFKKKSNPLKQKDLFKKSCQTLELSELEGKDLNKIKKIYPQLAKKNKNDRQKLIQLNQSFLFLRVFYFKTQFGTTAVYENDDLEIFKKHCEVLDLSEEDAMNIASVKGNFSSKMTLYRLNKVKRIEVSVAFEYLANRIFKVQKSAQEIKLIDAVIVSDKETLIQMFRQDKELINFRQKGSEYSLLYIAVRSGHYEIVELILRMGCSKDFSNDNSKSTPLHCAAFYEHKYILELLLSYGLPHNVRNSNGQLPIDEANSEDIKKILKNVNKDEVQELILNLEAQGISHGFINVKDSNGNVMARKIFLSNYFNEHNDHVDALHGTNFEALESIAKHGLRKPGTILDGKEIKVAAGHIGEERLQIEEAQEKKDTWSEAIFLSESYNYASCPCYSKDYHTMDHISGRNEQWAPLIQAKLKKNTYTSHQSTTDDHEILFNEPFQLEYRVQDSNNVTVVAIILLRRQYMREKQNRNYLKTTQLILNSREETLFKLNIEQSEGRKPKCINIEGDDNHFGSLLNYLVKQNLYESANNIYFKDKILIGRKITLKSGISHSSQYVNAYHVTDYNSLWLLKKYGIGHLLNERKQFFVSPHLFDYKEIPSLPKFKTVNMSTSQREQWVVVLQIKVNKSVFLQSKRSQEFVSNWKDLTNMKFRIKPQFLQSTDLRLHLAGLIFIKVKFITSEDKYKAIINQIQ